MPILKRFLVESLSITPDNIAVYRDVFEDAEGYVIEVDYENSRLIGRARSVTAIRPGLLEIDPVTVVSRAYRSVFWD